MEELGELMRYAKAAQLQDVQMNATKTLPALVSISMKELPRLAGCITTTPKSSCQRAAQNATAT